MLHQLYEKLLEHRILRAEERIPSHILLVLNEADLRERRRSAHSDGEDGAEKLRKFVKWCRSLRIKCISIYVSMHDGCEHVCDIVERVIWALSVYNDASLSIYTSSPSSSSSQSSASRSSSASPSLFFKSPSENAQFEITISVGYGGRSELTNAFRKIAEDVRSGMIEPADIDEKMIEDALTFRSEPDLIIRSGCTQLTDFLIWQSVYSELYFTDVNWHKFRRIDLLRAIRDFQTRERRFGR